MATEQERQELARALQTWLERSPHPTIRAAADAIGVKYSTLKDYFEARAVPGLSNRRLLEAAGALPPALYSVASMDLETIGPVGISAPDLHKSQDLSQTADVQSSRENGGGSSTSSFFEAAGPSFDVGKNIRIAVSGDVVLNKLETLIIDTPEFRRLQSIKQLGTAYLVYPSALHTRFEHSLGTLFEADRMVKMIEDNQGRSSKISLEDKALIRLAALLHDLGHVPFGHSLEEETRTLQGRHDENTQRMRILLDDSEIGKAITAALTPSGFTILKKIMAAKDEAVPALGEFAYIADLVNNTLCADLLDYLQRDVYFCNLAESFGTRFLRYLFIDSVDDDLNLGGSGPRRLVVRLGKEGGIGYRPDIFSELVNLLRVRYTIGEKVYYHHAKISASAMIASSIWSAMNDTDSPQLTESDLTYMGDERLLYWLRDTSGSPVANRLADAVLRRKLHKQVWQHHRREAQAQPQAEWQSELVGRYHDDPAYRHKIANEMAQLCGGQPGDVLIYCPPPEMAKKYAAMLVEWAGRAIPLRQVAERVNDSTVGALESIEQAHQDLWSFRVFASREIQQDETRLMTLRDLCEALFLPPQLGDRDTNRRLQHALRVIVGREIGSRGNAELVNVVLERVMSPARGRPQTELPSLDSIRQEVETALRLGS